MYLYTYDCYEALRLAKIYHSDGDMPSSAGMVSHFKDSTTTPVRAGKLRNLTAQALDVKWHPATGKLYRDIIDVIDVYLWSCQNRMCLISMQKYFTCFPSAFRHWIATASYAGEVVLWNVERNNGPSAKGPNALHPRPFYCSTHYFLSTCIRSRVRHTLPSCAQKDEFTCTTAIVERQFKQPGSISLNIGSGRLCWTANPHLIVSCFRDNYVRLWVSTPTFRRAGNPHTPEGTLIQTPLSHTRAHA